jgi:hypothetical protein
VVAELHKGEGSLNRRFRKGNWNSCPERITEGEIGYDDEIDSQQLSEVVQRESRRPLHALHKPNEADVPFDVRHVRVIYYDINNLFWGDKLIAKVSEKVASALADPKEAIQFPEQWGLLRFCKYQKEYP